MEWFAWLFFESLPALGAALFVINFVLLAYWRRSERVLPLLVGLALAMVLLGVQTLVITRQEHAIRMLAAIERDVVAARTDSLAATLAPDFKTGKMGPDEFLEYVERQYERVRVHSTNRGRLEIIESLPDRFMVEVAYTPDVTVGGYEGRLPTRWRFTFVRTETGWRIASLRPIHVARLSNPGWDELNAP